MRPVARNISWLSSITGLLTYIRLGPIPGWRTIAWSAASLGIITGLRPVARGTRTLRDATVLGTVVWVTWILRSSHPARLSPPPEILLDALRPREILSNPKPVDDHNDLPPAPGHIPQPATSPAFHPTTSASFLKRGDAG
ncbi:hypothetical protein ATCC27039_07190 [Actinomyces naeslundii]|nr:hypothetical protein ATCC27039_07190 [Actinomyces naeslundii]